MPRRSNKPSPEAAAARQGFCHIAGIDEAGRGPWAGPVVAAAVMLGRRRFRCRIDDSKRMTARMRQRSYNEIVGRVAVGVGDATAQEIDAIGILQATALAMQRAVSALPITPDFLLIDGIVPMPGELPRRYLIRGESISRSIASASIVAKVTRDHMMDAWDTIYPGYGLSRHRGYGTVEHRRALAARGPTPIHRKSFRPIQQLQSAATTS